MIKFLNCRRNSDVIFRVTNVGNYYSNTKLSLSSKTGKLFLNV